MAGSLLERIFGRSDKSAKSVAKDRLLVVLKQDRASIPGPVLEKMRREMIAIFNKYLELDEQELEVSVERDGESAALVANIPIRRVRSEVL